MAIEQFRSEGMSAATVPPAAAQPSTWAAKWDTWWMRVVVIGLSLMTVTELFTLERSIWAFGWELKVLIAFPLLFGAEVVRKVSQARRESRIEKELSDQILSSVGFILWFTYTGMVGLLRHVCHFG